MTHSCLILEVLCDDGEIAPIPVEQPLPSLEDIALPAPFGIVEVERVPLASDKVGVRIVDRRRPQVPLATEVVQHQLRLPVLLTHVKEEDVPRCGEVEIAACKGPAFLTFAQRV
jgi:hypothetical protein